MIKLLVLLILSSALLSCSLDNEDSEGIKALVAVYDFETKEYTLKSKRIPSLIAPVGIDTHVAQFFYKVDYRYDVNYETPIKLNLSRGSGGTYYPQDVQTLNALSSYYIYDLLHQFHSKLGTLSKSQWPKKVNIEAVSDEIKNNAGHIPELNTTHYFYFENNHLPAHLNPGIVAHEEEHAIFTQQVYKRNGALTQGQINCAYNMWKYPFKNFYLKDCVQSFDNTTNFGVLVRNQAILSSLDEGLSDFAGYVFSGRSDFLYHSLSFESMTSTINRAVNQALYLERFPDEKEVDSQLSRLLGLSASSEAFDFFTQRTNDTSFSLKIPTLVDFSYAMGGQLSKLFNILSLDLEVPTEFLHLNPQEYMYMLLVNRLIEINQQVIASHFISEQVTYTQIFDALFNETILTHKNCAFLKQAFASNEVPVICDGEKE